MAKSAMGSGSVKKHTRTGKNGKKYIYWIGRVTTGTDPATGKQAQKTVTAKTQKECAAIVREILLELENGTYIKKNGLTLKEWSETWLNEYCGTITENTAYSYKLVFKNHINPKIGALKIQELTPPIIQKLYNDIYREDKNLSPKTMKNIHAILRKCLQTALEVEYIRSNPCDRCKLPAKVERHEMHTLTTETLPSFLKAVKGHRYEEYYLLSIYSGCRQGELLGLRWSDVDFKKNSISINHQLQKDKETGVWKMTSTKTNKTRTIILSPSAMRILSDLKIKQREQMKSSPIWNNPYNLVFTHADGTLLSSRTVYKAYKVLVASIGMPELRIHDLRHSYATLSLQAGATVKAVQNALGHTTASITLDIYSHVTDEMQLDAAQKMEQIISKIS